MDVIRDFSLGTQIGGTLTEHKRFEDSVLAGRNVYLSSVFQISQVEFATKSTSLALQKVGFAPVSTYTRVFLWITPIALAIVTKMGITNDIARKTLIFIQEHYGTLCHIVAAVSSIVLIYFGSVLLGATTLTFLAIGLLDRKGLLPLRVRHILHDYMQPVLIATGFASGDTFAIILATISLVIFCVEKYLDWRAKREFEGRVEGKKDCLTFADAFGVMHSSQSSDFATEKAYINYKTMPSIPDIDIDRLNTLFNQIDWNAKNKQTLRVKLQYDERFKEREGSVDKKSDEQLIAFAKNSLKVFVQSVKNRYIPTGEPRDYTLMHNYLKYIAHRLSNEENEITRVDALLVLAVQGGEYCGPGKFGAAEAIFEQFTLTDQESSLRTKILRLLQFARKNYFEKFYEQVTHQLPARIIGKVIDWHDIHTYNRLCQVYGSGLNILKASADNDATAVLDPLTRLVLKPVSLMVMRGFWENHTPDELVKTILKALSSSSNQVSMIRPSEINDWCKEWIKRQTLSEEEKARLLDDFEGRNADHEYFPAFLDETVETLSVGAGRFNPKIIYAMLVDMGIINITSRSNWEKPNAAGSVEGEREQRALLRA